MPKNDYRAAKFCLAATVAVLSFWTLRPASAQAAAPQCRWINTATGDETAACQRRFGSAAQPWSTGRDCTAADLGSYDNTCCCPVLAPTAKPTNVRLVIIGSVVSFFAIMTVGVIIYNKNT